MARSSNFTRIIDSILKAEPVYVKSTGVKVLVTDIDTHKGQKSIHARIKFLDTPNKKVLVTCEQCNVDVRENNRPPTPLGHPAPAYVPTYDIQVTAVIDIDNLSTTPYETKAAKILYKNQK